MQKRYLTLGLLIILTIFLIRNKVVVTPITSSAAGTLLQPATQNLWHGTKKTRSHDPLLKASSSLNAIKPFYLKDFSQIRPSEIYCFLQKKGLSIPLGEGTKFQYGNYKSKDSKGVYVWAKSNQCPDNLYSIIKINDKGETEKRISCEETSLTELSLESGMQFTLNPHRRISF